MPTDRIVVTVKPIEECDLEDLRRRRAFVMQVVTRAMRAAVAELVEGGQSLSSDTSVNQLNSQVQK